MYTLPILILFFSNTWIVLLNNFCNTGLLGGSQTSMGGSLDLLIGMPLNFLGNNELFGGSLKPSGRSLELSGEVT